MTPTVVNRHHWCSCSGPVVSTEPGPDYYVVANCRCRRGRRLPPEAIYIGRGTALGNPFKYPEVPDALERYRRWLWEQIKAGNPGVMAMLKAIGPDSLLVCSCKPRPCHGDVVVRAWEWLNSTGNH